MNDIEKKLDALIDALGFDVEAVISNEFIGCYSGVDQYRDQVSGYKLTKRQDDEQRKNNLYIAAVNEFRTGASTLEEFAAMVIASELTR